MKALVRSAILLTSCLALLACHRHHDIDLGQLGPPSQRLTGHWADSVGDQFYFGPLDAASGEGEFTMVRPDGGGQRLRQHYALINEEVDTQTAVVNLLFARGDSRSESFAISADGNTLTSGTLLDDHYVTVQYHRVDNAIVPPKSYGIDMLGNTDTQVQSPSNEPPAPRWNSPRPTEKLSLNGAIERQHAAARATSYVLWLHVTALALLLVASLMFQSNLGWVTTAIHWTVAVAGGAICIFLFHAVIAAGILENAVALAMLARGLFPKNSLS